MTTQKSIYSYSHDFPDGSDITVRCERDDEQVRFHLKGAKEMPDNTMLSVIVRKSAIESVLNTPIGGMPTMKETERKEFDMTFKQYKKFITRFWENGPDYYDQI